MNAHIVQGSPWYQFLSNTVSEDLPIYDRLIESTISLPHASQHTKHTNGCFESTSSASAGRHGWSEESGRQKEGQSVLVTISNGSL